jgi:heptosyltransferase-2
VNVAVIRFSSLGDCILLCPLLAHLKASGADDVTVVTKTAYAEVFAYATGADRVVAIDTDKGLASLESAARSLREGGYDVIDAHNNWRSRYLCARLGGAGSRFEKHYRARLGLIVFKRRSDIPTMLERYGELSEPLGVGAAPAAPGGLAVPERSRAGAARALARFERAVAVAPGSRWPAKRWPIERFVETATALVERLGVGVVLVGDEHDAEVARPIAEALGERCVDATGSRSVMETAAWIEACGGFVGNDSGLMHLAEAVGTPATALFGPTVSEFGYYPALERSRTVERALGCRPCSRNGSRPCPRRVRECMEYDADAVVAAAVGMLEGTGPRRHVLQ